MKPRFFSDADAFRKWLEKNHKHKKEILVGFYKAKTGKANMNWSDSVDLALCFGWIDGVRKSIDSGRYTIRFSPRKENSIWSLINIKKMKTLTARDLWNQLARLSLESGRKSTLPPRRHHTKKLPFIG
jgi:uncharacterized protein YdeI (YjbR/CyaY-like superfamily)